MKKFYFFSLFLCCAYLSPLYAQTDSSNCTIRPEFSWHKDSVNCRKVWFFNQSVPISPNVHFVWKFGDGTSSNDVNPAHVYQQDGVYTVCLVIESGNNCRKEICKQVEVRCQTTVCNFEVKFEWRRDTLNPLKVFFINNTPVTTSAAQYLWTFGDGSTSTDRNPVHTYAAPGAYKVCLRVALSNTCVRELCKEINLQPPPPQACNVQSKFVWRRDSAQWNKVWFANLSQPVQNIWRTSWSYGDGTASQDFNSFHVYQQPGKYYVCLKVQSLNGCISTYCDSVIVRKPESCESVHVTFEYKRNHEKPYIISFHAIGSVPIVQQTWSITRLTNVPVFPPQLPVLINANNPTYTFKDSGWYLVCLYAVISNNCKKTYCEKIYVPHGQNGRTITGRIPVYPNPANKLVRLELELEQSALLQVRVLDGTGAPKMQFVSPGYRGNNNIAIPVEKLSNGSYVVEIRYGNQLKLAKFQKS